MIFFKRVFLTNFKGVRFLSKDIIPKYVELEIKNIVKTHFNIEDVKNLDKYSTFLTQERLNEIHLFRGYKLISKHVYNFIYLYLINEQNIDKELIIENLKNEVEFNNSEIELIKKNNWSIKDYNYRNEIKSIKEENKDLNKKNYSRKIEIIPDEVISFDKYVFCTNCGLSIYGFREGTIGGILGSISCTCNQKNKKIDCRNKNYCGVCGKNLNFQYCGYCGSKNY